MLYRYRLISNMYTTWKYNLVNAACDCVAVLHSFGIPFFLMFAFYLRNPLYQWITIFRLLHIFVIASAKAITSSRKEDSVLHGSTTLTLFEIKVPALLRWFFYASLKRQEGIVFSAQLGILKLSVFDLKIGYCLLIHNVIFGTSWRIRHFLQ